MSHVRSISGASEENHRTYPRYRGPSMELALQVRGSYEVVLSVARFVEERNLAALALPDHYLFGRSEADFSEEAWDAFAQLAGLARETEGIGLVVLVSPITFRHPAVLLKSAVSIDLMSGGRFSLGVGAGWLDEEHEMLGIPYPSTRQRFELLEEGLGYLRAALAGRGYEGRDFRLKAFDMNPMPSVPLSLVVGGTGRTKTPQLAGRYADEYNGYASVPEVMRERIETARTAARAAGRDPSDLRLSTTSPAVVGHDGASYRKRLQAFAETMGRSPDELEERWRNVLGYPLGTSDEVAPVLRVWEEMGISRYYAQLFGATDPASMAETVEALGF